MTGATRNISRETESARIQRRKRLTRIQQEWACAVAQFRKDRESTT